MSDEVKKNRNTEAQPASPQRRRMLKGAAASPIILTAVSRPVLGGACTGSALASGTQSGPNQPVSCSGCSHGYWKNHPGNWPAGFLPDDLFRIYFPSARNELGNKKLLDVLKLGGGGESRLAREAVGALLNAAAFGPGGQFMPGTYGLSVSQVQTQVNRALVAGDWSFATTLENLHDGGIYGANGDVVCPL